MVYAYCDGDTQTIFLAYYGLGKNYDIYGDTFIYYEIDKNGKVKVSDPNGDVNSLEAKFMEVVKSDIRMNYKEYMNNDKFITYEEFNQFKEGCIKETYFPELNKKLRDSYE